MSGPRSRVAGGLAAGLAGLFLVALRPVAGDDTPGPEIPPALAPFEYLIGSWKGAGVPLANRVRGWDETHAWAWKFDKGTPVGLSVTLKGDRVLSKGVLRFDPAAKRYALEGTDPAGKPVRFVGSIIKGGKTLTLDREGATS